VGKSYPLKLKSIMLKFGYWEDRGGGLYDPLVSSKTFRNTRCFEAWLSSFSGYTL